MATNSHIHSWKAQRPMVMEEYFAAQGFAVRPGLVDDSVLVPWKDAFNDEKMTRRMRECLCGLGMHAEVVGTLILYALGRSHKYNMRVPHHLCLVCTAEAAEFDDDDVD